MPRQTDVRMEGLRKGWKDGQTLFYRTFPATAGGPISEIRDYFIAEIWERELMSKRFSKYIAIFIILINL